MVASERQIIAQPTASAGGRVISSPFQFYTTGEDRLRVTSFNSLPGVALKIQSRFVDSAGKVQANADDHVPLSNRTARITEHELGNGALLNLTVFASAGAPQIGQTFVIVQLIRGASAAAIILGTLLQGYVTASQHLGWPGSPIQLSTEGQGSLRSIAGTNPAIGAEINESVPTGARWQFISALINFTASANVATRCPRFAFFDPAIGQYLGVYTSGLSITASQNVANTWAAGMGTALYESFFIPLTPLPTDTPLRAGTQFRTLTAGMQANDQYTGITYYTREWLAVE
jgi:hypothetical protein